MEVVVFFISLCQLTVREPRLQSSLSQPKIDRLRYCFSWLMLCVKCLVCHILQPNGNVHVFLDITRLPSIAAERQTDEDEGLADSRTVCTHNSKTRPLRRMIRTFWTWRCEWKRHGHRLIRQTRAPSTDRQTLAPAGVVHCLRVRPPTNTETASRIWSSIERRQRHTPLRYTPPHEYLSLTDNDYCTSAAGVQLNRMHNSPTYYSEIINSRLTTRFNT